MPGAGKKILIVYATAGIGHAKAAFAVRKAFDDPGLRESLPDVEITLIDSLDHTTPFFKRSYLNTYLLLVKKLVWVWGALYRLANIPLFDRMVRKMRRLNNSIFCGKFVAYLLSEKPDIIISTHFLANEVVSNLKERGLLSSRLMSVVTDYRAHAFWFAKGIDAYIVGSEDAGEDLVKWGAARSAIKVFGIPVEPEFVRDEPADKDKARRSLGIAERKFTILLVGGGFGVGPIEKILGIVGHWKGPLQVAVICGYNKVLLERVRLLKAGTEIDIYEFGFVKNMHEFMEAADVLISKSGGITVSEALAKELPMLVVAPIPGQESGNCDYLVRKGASLRIRDLGNLIDVLKSFVENPERVDALKDKIRKIRRPNALFDIARYAVDMLSAGRKEAE